MIGDLSHFRNAGFRSNESGTRDSHDALINAARGRAGQKIPRFFRNILAYDSKITAPEFPDIRASVKTGRRVPFCMRVGSDPLLEKIFKHLSIVWTSHTLGHRNVHVKRVNCTRYERDEEGR